MSDNEGMKRQRPPSVMVRKCRMKNAIVFGLFALTTAIAIFFISSPSPSIKSMLSETQKQIINLKNMNVVAKPKRSRPLKHDINPAPYHLELLGFNNQPRLYSNAASQSVMLPVIVTAVTAHDYESAIELVHSVQKHLRNHTVIIYDLGLGSYELLKLKKHCNSSDVCSIHLLDYEKFPRHVKEHKSTYAYEPIVIQQMLNEYGAVIWVSADSEEFFQTGEIADVLRHAERVGIVAWQLESKEPTSAYTHPGMFTHFNTKPSSCHFQHMVRATHLVIYNTQRIHTSVMRPWIGCALDRSCIAPLGAVSGSRCVRRRPRYLYSGCHRFAESALNVVLGLAFGFEDYEYSMDNFTVFFGVDTATTASNVSTTFSSLVTNRKHSADDAYL